MKANPRLLNIARRCLSVLTVMAVVQACGETEGCGGGPTPEYAYPRGAAGADPTEGVLRARITEQGFATLARAVPGILRATCAMSDSCTPDPMSPDVIRFDLESGDIQAGSYIAIDTASMEDNVTIRIIPPAAGGGIEVILGCTGLTCNDPSEHVNGSADLIWDVFGATCQVQDRAVVDPSGGHGPGLVLRTFRFRLDPKVIADPVGRPVLEFAEEDLQIDQIDLVTELDASAAPGCSSGCSNCSTFLDPIISIGAQLSPFLAAPLANVITQQLAESLADQNLDIEGGLTLQEFLSVANPDAETTGYLALANAANSPSITGPVGNMGWNIDFDAGFVADPALCVPRIVPPNFDLPAPPDPGNTVPAIDPDTGLEGPEGFDATIIVGDSVANRALFELYDGGSLCLPLEAEALGELTDNAFVTTVGVVSLIAPDLAGLAAQDVPVDLRIVPKLPPVLRWGTGDDIDNSHLQLDWQRVSIELYPLLDHATTRVIAFEADLDIGLSATPSPAGIGLMIDRLELINVGETYNEILPPFDAQGISDLLAVLLPNVLSEAFEFEINAETLGGFPLVPKIRAVERSSDSRFLGVFLRFCTDEEITDENNALCYEDASMLLGRSDTSENFAVEVVKPPNETAGEMVVRVDAAPGLDRLELAYRLDGGPWFSFRTPDADGTYRVEHPGLVWPGRHRLTFVARDPALPQRWSQEQDLFVTIDRIAPNLTGTLFDGTVYLNAWDDLTPTDALVTYGSLIDAFGVEHRLSPEVREIVDLAPGERLALVARDEAGLESRELVVVASIQIPAYEAPANSGCSSTPTPVFALALIPLLLRRRLGRDEAPVES